MLIVVIIVGGYTIWQSGYFNPTATPSPSVTSSPTPTPETSPTPEPSTEEQVREAAMTYIKTNHNETATYMLSLSWTGGRTTPSGILGAETYSYQSVGWNVTMQYPVVLNPIYTVTADYISPVSQVFPAEKIIVWLGTWQNGTVSETSYNNTNLLIQEQVRNTVMSYLKSKHPETAQFMQSFNWTGGRVIPETPLVGSETYTYLSTGWNVTIHYPVVANPIYNITVNYADGYSVTWQGTYQNGTMKETSYVFSSAPQLSTQEQIRNSIMTYIKTNHNETAQFMESFNWTGGKVTPETPLVGSETYTYLSTGWNVTMKYPVVLNPIFTVTANYSEPAGIVGFSSVGWQGTWQNGTITETGYTFAQ